MNRILQEISKKIIILQASDDWLISHLQTSESAYYIVDCGFIEESGFRAEDGGGHCDDDVCSFR